MSNIALRYAAEGAAERGIDLECVRHDLEADGLPDRTWDVALIHLFFDRQVLDAAPQHLNVGGLLAFMQPTARNLDSHPSPSRRFLVDEGEIGSWAAGRADLEVVSIAEGWMPTGRHETQLLARRV